MNNAKNAEAIERLTASAINLATALPSPNHKANTEKALLIDELKRVQKRLAAYNVAASIRTVPA